MPKKNNTISEPLHSNKVFQVLQLLDKSDCKKLMKFMQSPYFNNSKTLCQLCEIFLEIINLGQLEGFEKKWVWKKIFPKDTYDDVNFRKYCSDLLKLTETFLAHNALEEDEAGLNVLLYQTAVKKKIEPLYASTLRNAQEKSKGSDFKSSFQYLQGYEVERSFYAMSEFDVKVADKKVNIEEISSNLDYFYWIEKLKLYCSALSHRQTTYQEYKIDLIDPIIKNIENIDVETIPELSVYFYTYQTLTNVDNTEYYYKLKKILENFGDVITQKDAIGLFDSTLNYCTGKLNKGNQIFLLEYFEVFEVAIKKKVYIVNGEIAQWRFNNIVAAALRLGKLDWTENFIINYKEFLNISSRENTYTFNLARVYRYQKKFEKVLTLLRNIEYEDIAYNRISKTMLIISYYELDEYDALDSFMESFRVYLSRHKNVPVRNSYLNLIKYVRRLTRLAPKDKTTLEKLRQDLISEKETTVNYDWLMEKIEELS
jgi:hypothetical protein